MKVPHFKWLRRASLLVALCSLWFPVRAATDAVTTSGQAGVGFNAGGVGFSFTPGTNIEVTRVGYEYHGVTNPVVSVWSGTNFVMASFPLIAGSTEGQMVYSNTSLQLLGGHRYSITLHAGAPTNGNVLLFAYSTNGQFQVATQLTSYVSALVNSSGAFVNPNTNVFYRGPNFSFQVSTSAVSPPVLSIAMTNSNTTVVSWPAPSTGFLLQHVTTLNNTNWDLVTNAVSMVGGTNEVAITPLQAEEFFRLIYP